MTWQWPSGSQEDVLAFKGGDFTNCQKRKDTAFNLPREQMELSSSHSEVNHKNKSWFESSVVKVLCWDTASFCQPFSPELFV